MREATDTRRRVVLLADDDEDDRELARDALAEANDGADMRDVGDGQHLMDYLHRRSPYAEAPRPEVILLDLNMPRKDGWEALREIKKDPDLRRIPVLVLTTSSDQEDVTRAYDLGASGYVTKPVAFDALVDVMRSWSSYWFGLVELPHPGHAGR